MYADIKLLNINNINIPVIDLSFIFTFCDIKQQNMVIFIASIIKCKKWIIKYYQVLLF